MASNLTKDWIQYLKNNQIAALQSDPESGRINYKRKVTASDVVNFLQVKTDYDDDAINTAIDKVVGSRQPESNISAQEPQATSREPDNNTQQKKYNNSDATDVEPRYGPRPSLTGPKQALPAPAAQTPSKKPHTGGKKKGEVSQTPTAIRKRQARSNRKAGLNEDFVDNPGEDLSEKEVESIFKILAGSEKSSQDVSQVGKRNTKLDAQKVRTEEVEKLKSVISDSMSAEQRKQLWDALQQTLNEGYADKSDVRQIFNYLSKDNSHRNSSIDIGSLQKAWASEGYPNDTGDIARILAKFGFDEQAIESAFVNVLGNDYDTDDEQEQDDTIQPSDAVLKIADYIKRAGLTDEIVAFMQENFGKELTTEPKQGIFKRAMNYGKNLFKRKATAEDVRQIFANILKEERRGLSGILRKEEQKQLGRNKK